MAFDATLLILTGGVSRRMGFPKHILEIEGRTTVEYLVSALGPLFIETLVVGKAIPRKIIGAQFLRDVHQIRSPLAGIHSGLRASQADLCFVVGCDMPYVRPRLVQTVLQQADAVDIAVPMAGGHYEPLCAAYRRTALKAIEEAIRERRLKITELYDRVQTHIVREAELRAIDPELVSFTNLNTPRDVSRLDARFPSEPCHANRGGSPWGVTSYGACVGREHREACPPAASNRARM